MKRITLISAAILLAAASFGGISANAAAEETQYPQNDDFVFTLSFSELKDYAVGDNSFAFVDGNEIKVYENGTLDENAEGKAFVNGSLTVYGELDVTVSAIDWQSGTFYYSDGNGEVYSLPDGKPAEGVALTKSESDVNLNGYTYALLENSLRIINIHAENLEDMAVDKEGDFSCLKKYDNRVYAINGNVLYEFNGFDQNSVEMQYVDFSPAEKISVGQTSDALKDYTLTFVTVAENSFWTEIDLSEELFGYFDLIGDTHTTQVAEDSEALLLCYTGNAAIVAVGKRSFITLKSNVTESEPDEEWFSEAEFTKAQLLGDAIYASPFAYGCVSICDLTPGEIVKVNRRISHEVLEEAFYEVEYTYTASAGREVTVTGYVIEGLLTGDNVNDNAEPTEIPDGNYTEKNNVRTVLLVLMVVILVLIAISYLAWVGTSDKRKKKKNKKSDKENNE